MRVADSPPPTCPWARPVTPLDNFPLIRSRNIEEVREAIERVYAKPVMMPVRGTAVLDTTINNCRLPSIDLAYRAFGAPMGLKFPTNEFVVLLFPMSGKGEIVTGRTSIGVAAGAGMVVPSDAEHQ
jgi:hypothetical protein